jgi:glycosidase
MCKIYQFWIADADIDGYRIDTVKHMDPGATRYFASAIHEFTQSIGKENFYLIGEITGGRKNAFKTLDTTGLNAALGIDDIPDKLEYMVKGYRNPVE